MSPWLVHEAAGAGRSPENDAVRSGGRVDVDFSLAIHNRTGKYFIGRDVLAVLGGRLGVVRYGALALPRSPEGLLGRVLGRVQLWQVRGQTGERGPRIPRRRGGGRPLLHLDPFTVPTAPLRRRDAVLCHDVGPLTHPELFDAGVARMYGAIYREVAEVGPHLVFVSRASRDAFFALFPRARPASERVIYPMLRLEVKGGGTPPPGIGPAPFLLTVGSIGSRKNQARCIEAFALSGLADDGVRFVLCGGPEPGAAEVERAAAGTAGVRLLPYVSDAELAWLYGYAGGFVLASRLEGFGIPVAEAIAAGLVPLVSRGGVLDEVAGPGALAADPGSVGELAAAMRRLCFMQAGEKRARLAALERSIARFSPDGFARRWNAVFDDMTASDEIGSRDEAAPPPDAPRKTDKGARRRQDAASPRDGSCYDGA